MSLLHTILTDVQNAAHAVTGHPAAHQQAAPAQRPDITYNPNPNTNIPYSTHDPNAARAAANPALLRTLLNVVAPHLTADAGMTDQLQQGGEQNPGYTPLQGSYPVLPSTPGQATPQYQGYSAGDGIQAYRHLNPQVSDTGYYY